MHTLFYIFYSILSYFETIDYVYWIKVKGKAFKDITLIIVIICCTVDVFLSLKQLRSPLQLVQLSGMMKGCVESGCVEIPETYLMTTNAHTSTHTHIHIHTQTHTQTEILCIINKQKYFKIEI